MICGWFSKCSPYFLPGGEEDGAPAAAVSCCASRVDLSLDLPTEDSDIAGRPSPLSRRSLVGSSRVWLPPLTTLIRRSPNVLAGTPLLPSQIYSCSTVARTLHPSFVAAVGI